MQLRNTITTTLFGLTLLAAASAGAETIRIAIGTQDTTINCATGGLLIRELKLLEKYLPHDGKYKDAQYDIQWKNFTSGAPLTNEMVAGKLDIGSMADFPGSFNGAAFQKAGKKSLFITVLSGSTTGSGNGIVVPKGSTVQSLAELKGKTISVPFASTAHGMLLRAVKDQGWDPEKDVNIITQAPEVAGSALQSNKIEAHADFVPFAELFPHRGFARKIFDGSQANTPTFHGSLVDADYAKKYPEIVVAYLRAAIEANRIIAAEPEKYSELIEKVTGIEAEVNYLFHGPLGLQTRDFTWKPEYRQAVKTSIDTLKAMKRTDTELDPNTFVDDEYIKAAFKQSGLDYEAQLKNYAKSPLNARDALTGKAIAAPKRVGQIWVQGEPLVRHWKLFMTLSSSLPAQDGAQASVPASPGPAARPGQWPRLALRIASVAVCLLLWQWASQHRMNLGLLTFQNVPAPREVLAAAWALAQSPRLLSHLWASLARVFSGFAVAAAAGILLGMLIGRLRWLSDVLLPPLELLRPIPAVAWIPLAILMFPSSEISMIYITFIGALFPILLNTIHGVEGVDPRLIASARSLGSGRGAVFTQVILPAAAPSIVTGLSIGMGTAWFCLVTAEMIAGQFGIGYYTWAAYTIQNYADIVVGMMFIGILGMGSSAAIRQIGHLLMPWYRLQR